MLPAVIFGDMLLYLSMPNPVSLIPFGIFISFVPLFLINRRTNGLKRALLNALFSVFFSFLVVIPLDPGDLGPIFPDGLVLILLFAAVGMIYSISFTLSAGLSDRLDWRFSPLFYGLGWIMIEYLLSQYFILPPFPIGTSLVKFPALIQSASHFGTYLIDFMIIFTNAVIAFVLFERKTITSAILITILLVGQIFNYSYGATRLNEKGHLSHRMRIAIIQPNISVKEYELKNNCGLFKKIIDGQLIGLSKESLNNSPDLIIWPELTDDFVLQNDKRLVFLHREIASKGPDLLIGTSFMDYSNNSRKNIAFILKENGDMTEPYIKQRIFPCSESSIFTSGSGRRTLDTTHSGEIGVMICLESMYPQIARGEAKAGANALISISTDASFDNSMIPYIHSAEIVFRAIENDKYAVHCGNTGPSVICDNRGRILTYIPYGKQAYACAEISGKRQR